MPNTVTDEQLIELYATMQSVWKVGERVGLSGQQVHARLKAVGATRPARAFTDGERAVLIAEYETHADTGKLSELAERMGRTRQYLARQARALGLTNRNRSKTHMVERMSARALAWHAQHQHPRGFLGGKHTDAARAVMSAKVKARMAAMTVEQMTARNMKMLKTKSANGTMVLPRNGASWKAGWREIGGQRAYFRSRWEANYARYLELLRASGDIKSWEHEPETFWFDGVRRGAVSYLPDFKVIDCDDSVSYHEVKGWMDDRSATKLKRMKRYHPTVRMVLVDVGRYRMIESRLSQQIPGWER